MSGYDVLISKADLTKVAAVEVPQVPLAAGQARLRIDKLAITANTVTYAVAGDSFGYWQFFPAPEGQGKAPAWGFGVVEESASDDLRVGERFYGYFPIASHLTVKVGRADPAGFMDTTAHRQVLSPVYNQYTRVTNDPGYVAANEAMIAGLKPLFTTSFLIDGMLVKEDGFGAKQVLVSSASSKTGYGLAYMLKQRRFRVVGLTGANNVGFVEGLGLYDQVCRYDAITDLDPKVPTALVDMAGSASVKQAVHGHFGDSLVHSAIVGATHWTAPPAQEPLPGVAPALFFAPDYARRLIQELGPEGFQNTLGAAFADFCSYMGPRLKVRHLEGPGTVAQAFASASSGQVDPSEILTVRV
ncbi:MAG: DUF2855 family protein [Caulobacterales bacterium]|jgi:hypothetical protein